MPALPVFHALLATLATTVPAAQDGAISEAILTDGKLFVERVLPVLQATCYECHGPTERRVKGGLRILDRASLLTGGDTGPAVVPGDPDASLLIQAVRYEDDLLEMPPDGPLSKEDVAAMEAWVSGGAPWPEGVSAAPESEFSPEDLAFFETRVRPGLAENCFECHGPDVNAPKSGLRMSGRTALLIGGQRGPAIVPGDPDASLLVRAARRTGADVVMPPTGPVPAAFLADLEEWVLRGAPWPDEAPPPVEETVDIEAGRTWWSFRPVTRPPTPDVAHPELIASPIDTFLLARQEAAGILPNGPATKRELIRRATHDLHGLAPTLEEVEAFLADDAPDAWERLIDRLLSSPRYGERWGRHWLDLVRFAQTTGYERDTEKPFVWRYRDWVIDAFNADKPYDSFLLEQLAGDELEDADTDSLVATGFYRLGPWDAEPDDPTQAFYDELDDVLRTVSEGMLGVTMACARCHDHKFDPFPQEDYYALIAYLRNVRPYTDPSYTSDSPTLRLIDSSPEASALLEDERLARVAAMETEFESIQEAGRLRHVELRLPGLPPEVRQAWETPEDERSEADRRLIAATAEFHPGTAEVKRMLESAEKKRASALQLDLEELRVSYQGNAPWALCVTEPGPEVPLTHVLLRGKSSIPGDPVEPRFPLVLMPPDAPLPPEAVPPTDGRSSGRRLQLAEWITDPENPLTARVIVNRVWQFHFGRGIVPSPNDFGRAGMPPTHPELLDWLAASFVEDDGWSLKSLHRRILSSNAYRMSSRADEPASVAADEANDLFWHQTLRRREAEAVRDTLLLASGELSTEAGGRGFFPRLSREALAGSSRPGLDWELSPLEERRRRAVYSFVKRSQPVPLLEVFDGPNLSLPVGRRSVTTLATQSLVLLNSEFVNGRAQALAEVVAAEAGDDPNARDSRITRAFERVLARAPGPDELALAQAFLAEQEQAFAAARTFIRLTPRVPERLDTSFLAQAQGTDLLYGPREGWVYAKGRWGNPYNGTLGADELRGPCLLREDVRFQNATVRGRFNLAPGDGSLGVLLRARLGEDDEVSGIEVRFEGEHRMVTVIAHGLDESRIGGTFPAPVNGGMWQDFGIRLRGNEVRVELDGRLVATLKNLPAPRPGVMGLRMMGEGVALDGLMLKTAEEERTLVADDPGPPDLRALEALCLTLFNLNEFVYVD